MGVTSLPRRLWRPAHPLFWLWVVFSALGAGCAWAARLPGIGAVGVTLFILLALANVLAGLAVARQLVRLTPPGAHRHQP